MQYGPAFQTSRLAQQVEEGKSGEAFKGLYLTPERQEVPAKRLSLHPSLVGNKAQQENQANQRGIRVIHKKRAFGINGL